MFVLELLSPFIGRGIRIIPFMVAGQAYSSVTQPSDADLTFLIYLNSVPRVAL